MKLISNMRMYGVNPPIAHLWKDLTDWLMMTSGITLEYLEHKAPAPMNELWDRPDMGLVQMCGWPYWRRSPRPQIIAAPIIDHEFAQDEPVYWSELVTRSDSYAARLEDTFGGKIAWTVKNSHSGCNAPRHTLLPHFLSNGKPLYSESIGPVITPRGAIDAVLSGKADIAPVDSYYHLLLERHEPETLTKLKTIARTEKAPIPVLVAAHGLNKSIVNDLRSVLSRAHENQIANHLLKQLAIRKFVVPESENYALAETWHEEALKNGHLLPS